LDVCNQSAADHQGSTAAGQRKRPSKNFWSVRCALG
jgi:hypothetical protein